MIFTKWIILCSVLWQEILGRRVYNTETYTIGINQRRRMGLYTDNSYWITNVGRTKLYYEFRNYYNEKYLEEEYYVNPGKSKYAKMSQVKKIVYITNLSNDTTGYGHLTGTHTMYNEYDDSSLNDLKTINTDYGPLIKTVVAHCASFIPYIGDTLSTAISFFWPAPDQPSAWDEVKDQVEKYVDEKAQKIVKGILGGDLRSVQEKVETLSEELDDPDYEGKLGKYFMTTSDILVGFEQKFIFSKNDDPDADDVNYYLLPMYADLINLKMVLYQYGIINHEKIGLEPHQKKRLGTYIRRVVGDERRGAIKHINQVFKQQFFKEYEHGYPETIYERIISVRTYCTLNGLQHIPIWKAIAENPENGTKPDNPVLVYSTSFGRSEAEQSAMITQDSIPPPLQPKVIDGKLNQPVSIEVFLYTKRDPPQISGMNITYANGDVLYTGADSDNAEKSVKIDFNNSKLMNLTAHGKGKIVGLEFHFEDGRNEMVGYKDGPQRTFSLGGHHIVGFFMTASSLLYKYRVANVVVGYKVILIH